MKYPGILLLLFFISCHNKKDVPLPEAPAPVVKTTSDTEPLQPTLKDSMLGVWTNETSENGIFDITDSTFYYGDTFEDYRYVLKDKKIIIHYPDHDYHATVSFHGDTLVMDAKDGRKSRYWRFRQ